jgi:preprotein translocase subunit SecD
VRLLVALAVLIVGLSAAAFWPGTDTTVRLGLDLRGGTQVILKPSPVSEGDAITDEQLEQTVSIIRQRVDGLGVAEAEVTTQGSGEGAVIVVSVPGVNQDRIVDLVQRTALLNFRPVWGIYSPVPDPSAVAAASASASPQASPEGDAAESPAASPEPSASASPEPSASASPDTTVTDVTNAPPLIQATENTDDYQQQIAALDCTDPVNYTGGRPDDPLKWLGTCEVSGQAKYNLEPAFIQGTNVTGANAVLPQGGVGWVVSLDFDAEGARALADASTTLSALPECGIAGANPCNAFAIVLDGVVTSAPRFNEPILGGSAQIEGNFTAEEARDLANILKYGALPVTLDPVDVTTISPTVGNEALRAGVIAGLLGLVLVAIYLMAYYRALGVVAVLSLVLAGGLTYMTFVVLSKTIGLTLTLAGIAGAIIAIGITADSFIVYFERIRDEIRDGRSLRQACDTGWVRARRTLLAADFISLLAAVVLYFLSVGSVRGFALVLGLTTVMDVIIAFWFTHPVTVLMGRSRWMQRGSKWTGLDAARLGGASVAGAAATTSRRRSTTQEVPS